MIAPKCMILNILNVPECLNSICDLTFYYLVTNINFLKFRRRTFRKAKVKGTILFYEIVKRASWDLLYIFFVEIFSNKIIFLQNALWIFFFQLTQSKNIKSFFIIIYAICTL